MFADESKEGCFVLAVAVVASGELRRMRTVVDGLRLPGQRRVHFKQERVARRKQIVSSLVTAKARVLILDVVDYRHAKAARDTSVARLADEAAKSGAERLVLERDDSAVQADRRIIRERLLEAGCHGTVRYEHLRAHEECLLAIPDAAAWYWAKSGMWRKWIEPIVCDVIRL